MTAEKISAIAEELSSKNKMIEFKQESIFTALETDTGELRNNMAIKIAATLKNDIIKYKNILLPFTKRYGEAVRTKLLETKQPNKLARFQVIEQIVPDIVRELQSKGILPAKRTPVMIPNSKLIMPTPKDGIRSVIKFSNSVLNSALEQVLVNYTDQDLDYLWDTYMSNISGTNDNIRTLSFRTIKNFNDVVLLVAIAGTLRTEKQPGITISESVYKEVMNAFYNELTNYLSVAVSNYNITTKLNKLVLGYGVNNNTIIVNAIVYKEFLKTSSIEALLGLLLSGERKLTGKQEIEIQAGKYISKWEAAVKLEAIREKNTESQRYRMVYGMALEVLLNEANNNIKENMECEAKGISNTVLAYINTLPVTEISDIELITRKIMGNIVFRSTTFGKFLEYMEDYAKIRTDIKPDEAATMASIDIIIDYLTQQIRVVDSTNTDIPIQPTLPINTNDSLVNTDGTV